MLIQTKEQFTELLQGIAKQPRLAVDTEYNKNRPWDQTRIMGVSLCWEYGGSFQSYYLPFRHVFGGLNFGEVNLPIEWLKILGDAIGREDLLTDWWNAKGDMKQFRKDGIEIKGPIRDGMVFSHMVCEWGTHKLKLFSDQVFGTDSSFEQKKLKEIEKSIGSWEQIPPVVMGKYAEKDAILTWRCVDHLIPLLKKQELDHLIEDQMGTLRALLDIEYRGLKIRRSVAQKLSQQAEARLEVLRAELGYDCMTDQLIHRLYSSPPEGLGFVPVEFGKPSKSFPKGKPSTGRSVLARYSHPEIPIVLETRSLVKANSTWFRGFLDVADKDDRVHTDFWQHGTVTSRLTSRRPNLHQLPRMKEEEVEQGVTQKLVKTMLDVTDGYELWEADYCLAPGTRVLTTDLRWVNIENLQVDDKVIGFDEELGKDTCFREAKVVTTKELNLPCYKITLDDGKEIIASGNHRWLTKERSAGGKGWKKRKWTKTIHLSCTRDYISKYIEPWDQPEGSYELGYLAGILDGEGHCSDRTVGVAQNPGHVLDYTLSILDDLNIEYGTNHSTQSDCYKYFFKGQRAGMTLLGKVRPPRLLGLSKSLWEGRRVWGGTNPVEPAKIVKLEHIGIHKVIALGTSTKTFIAEGLLSHNSQQEFRLAGVYGQEESILEAYRSGSDMHQLTAELMRIERQDAKMVNFLTIYGGGPNKLKDALGITFREAKEFLDEFWIKYPKLARFITAASNAAATRGWVKYWNGIKRHPRFVSEHHKMANSIIQGGCAQMMFRSMRNIHQADLPSHMVSQVHDSIWVEVPKDDVQTQLKQIKYHMEDWTEKQFDLLFAVDLKRLA